MRRSTAVLFFTAAAASVSAIQVDPSILDACPGYSATNIKTLHEGLTADLVLLPNSCNVFGDDIPNLSLSVIYETGDRIHLKITDPLFTRYEVPESVLPRPKGKVTANAHSAAIQFNYTTSPFSFSISRASTYEVLFTTAGHALIFEPQYLCVKTKLPSNPNIYGLGEHSNPFHLPTDNTTLTLWSRDANRIPTGTNLYGSHPVYFEHRNTGTHGVLLLNSDGMDIKLTNGVSALEYNVICGVLDFYFFAGSETDPTEVARQYAEVAGLPTEVPYWSFGFHQCRFGYQNFIMIDVAQVISKYAAAQIPLETMWTDIDYMDRRRIFTVDPNYFPLARMQEIVSYLHSHDQHYVLMTDPAVGYLPGEGYAPYENVKTLDVWLKAENGSESLGVDFAGVSVYPDWFHPKIQQYWTSEFESFYSPKTGIDIDGAWIDMNEPSNFCNLPCDDPFQQAIEQPMPPPRTNPPPDPNTPIFRDSVSKLAKREDYLTPPYAINNAAGALSSKTAFTNIKHANGLLEYNTHNIFGTMMSVVTRTALLARRPGKRTFVITRSTFVGAGAHVRKWLGDNLSIWDHYRLSIAGMLGFASIYQIPMISADSVETQPRICALVGPCWHNDDTAISQEFYIWPSVAQAARNAIDIRYRLLDYFYTAFHQSHLDGTPVLHPVWFKYPKDSNTYALDHQFFFGDSILVSPVTDDDATSVSIYLPQDTFYDFATLVPVQGAGSNINLGNVNFTQIPLHIKSGVVLPLRVQSAMTTKALRKNDSEFIVASNDHGEASGSLYIDDGESLVQAASTQVKMSFKKGKLDVSGSFGFTTGVNVSRIRFLGVNSPPKEVLVDGKTTGASQISYDSANKVLDVSIGKPFVKSFSVWYSI